MRTTLLMLFVLGTAMPSAHAQQSPKPSDFKKLGWLEGSWERTNAKPGRGTVETWKRVSDTELSGMAVYTKDGDTTLTEKIKIVVKDGKIFYVADVPENKEPVYFAFTELTENHFAVEDPTHDFPKKITYDLDGKNLKAVISGDGKSIEYLFVRK